MRPLLHRRKELALITAALDAIARPAGGGSVIVVTGGIGMGKTALLRALPALAERRGIRVVTAAGSVHERAFPLGVLDQLLTPLLPGTDLAPPDDRADPGAGAEHDAALFALVAEHGRRKPLLLLVDDLQWADLPSLHRLGRLAARLPRLRVTLVAALREGDPGEDEPHLQHLTARAAHLLRLGPLPADATAELAAAHLGRPVDQALAHACHASTGGHPLLLTATLDALAAADPGPAAPTPDALRALGALRPDGLRERLAAALRSARPTVWAFATALAVLGEGADEELAGRLAGLDDTGRGESARVLRRLGLLAEDTRPRFVHPVVREAIEEAMSPAEAQETRLHAALLLHHEGHPAERAAAQLLAAAPCEQAWALDVLRAAAHAALRRAAPDDAARYLRRALLAGRPDGPERAELLCELAGIERDFAPRAALRHFAEALLLLPDTDRRARAAGRIPPFLLEGCPPSTVEAVVRTAAELLAATPPDAATRGHALRLEARLRHAAVTGPTTPTTSGDRLRALGPAPRLDTAAERELVTVLLHDAVTTQQITAAEAVPLAERVLQHEPATPDHVHTALPLLTDVLAAAGSLDTIDPWLHTAYDRARRENVDVPRALIAVELTRLALARGDLARARAHAGEALDRGVTDWAALQTLAPVVVAALEARDATLCERLLAGCREHTGQGQRPSLRPLVRAAAAVLRDDLPTALACFLDWGRTAEGTGRRNPAISPWRSSASVLHHRMGSADRAHDLMDEEYARAVHWGGPVAIGRAQRGRGALTEGEPGLALLRESAATLERTANALERARTALLLGRRLLAAGREAEAEHRLTGAREEGLACGAPWIAERATRALGTIAGHRGADAVATLTRTERRVAGLAAAGTPNKAIAERLQVSSRAVEKHLTHAYRKLRIDGRAELAPMAALLADADPATHP
ncbi:LuxR family transcriptional regulator [Streptomyces sp. NPDC048606]|uniref:LuxR family transcriptional regulator n=1 Tax=Streptomyces sp. NPDC048606 TaxID=3154726 RepID=UPI00344302AE